jgi:putative transposase
LREWLPQTCEESKKKSRFTDDQMLAILREADGSSVSEVARKHKAHEQTL